jgi:hypothetical protein
MVSFVQVFTPNGGPLIVKGPPPKQLIEPGSVNAKKGRVMLTLKATPAGVAALKSGAPVKVYLSVSFKPNGGLPATKVFTLAFGSKH